MDPLAAGDSDLAFRSRNFEMGLVSSSVAVVASGLAEVGGKGASFEELRRSLAGDPASIISPVFGLSWHRIVRPSSGKVLSSCPPNALKNMSVLTNFPVLSECCPYGLAAPVCCGL